MFSIARVQCADHSSTWSKRASDGSSKDSGYIGSPDGSSPVNTQTSPPTSRTGNAVAPNRWRGASGLKGTCAQVPSPPNSHPWNAQARRPSPVRRPSASDTDRCGHRSRRTDARPSPARQATKGSDAMTWRRGVAVTDAAGASGVHWPANPGNMPSE